MSYANNDSYANDEFQRLSDERASVDSLVGDWGNLVYSDYDDEPAPREYVTRNECIQREIVEALGEYAAEHDVAAIADEAVETVGTGTLLRFRVAVMGADFWEVVQRHAIA